MFTATILLATVFPLLAPFFPSPQDKDGWGLRVHRLSRESPFLAGETIDQCWFWVTLINFSDRTRTHDPLIVAVGSRDLEVVIIGPDREPLDKISIRSTGRDPFAVEAKLPRGESASCEFRFAGFGYHLLKMPGRYRVEAKMEIGGKAVSAPPIEFEVLPLKAETVLASRAVRLEGDWQAKLPPEQQARPFVQQVQVGNRTWLIYRRYNGPKYGGGIGGTFRLAELPGKCEMQVTGAYGEWSPLTITYVDKNAPNGKTTLVINSVDGTPWTDEDKEVYDNYHKIAPAPRAKP